MQQTQQSVIRQETAPPKRVVEENYASNQPKQPQAVSGKRTPTQSIEGRPTTTNINKPVVEMPATRQSQMQKVEPQINSATNIKQEFDDEIDLRLYATPPPGNPLGRHLSKLMNPNEVADPLIAFFTNLFA